MDRYLLVSSDCHANPTLGQYRSYLDPKYVDDYDDFARGQTSVGTRPFRFGTATVDPWGKRVREAWDRAMGETRTGEASSDPSVRARELDQEGVAAEVIFPLAQTPDDAPLPVSGVSIPADLPYDLLKAAVRAYNRWLADFCAANPDRHVGVALVPPAHDVQAVVEEIRWARNAGVRGGIVMPAVPLTNTDPERFLNHPRYEPVWAACEDLEMPLHSHMGVAQYLDYGEAPGAHWIHNQDQLISHHRTFGFLLWSGVFERHPRLKWVVTEIGGTWAVFVLQRADHAFEFRNPEVARQILSMKPSEYWARQCYIGASPPSGRGDVDARRELGVDKIMWGSDYPHREGTWPFTQKRLDEMFTGIPEAEVRMMVGENAADLYGFDRASLDAIAERIGPKVGELGKV